MCNPCLDRGGFPFQHAKYIRLHGPGWQVRIPIGPRQRLSLGCYPSIDEAVEARRRFVRLLARCSIAEAVKKFRREVA